MHDDIRDASSWLFARFLRRWTGIELPENVWMQAGIKLFGFFVVMGVAYLILAFSESPDTVLRWITGGAAAVSLLVSFLYIIKGVAGR